jgi:F-box and leucine-rich repeat protein 10/11
MASGRRRSARHAANHENESSTDHCPACTDESVQNLQVEDKEEWAMCGACKTWYHWRCAGNGEELDTVDKWCLTPLFAMMTTDIYTQVLQVLS